VPLLVYFKKYKLLFAFALLGFYTSFFNLDFGGFKFQIAAFSTLCIIIIEKRLIVFEKSIFGKYMWLEWIIMAIVGSYFVFINPWDDAFEKYRLVTQQLPTRTLVGLIRFLELIFTFHFFVYVFKEGFIDLKLYVKTILAFVILNFGIGILDYLVFQGSVKLFFMPDHYSLYRFTGLMLEPRYIGQIMTLSIFSFIAVGFKVHGWEKYTILGILISLIGVSLSFSSTAIVYLTLVLFIYFLLGKVKLKYFLLSLFIYAFGGLLLLNNQNFVEHQTKRIREVGLELAISQIPGVPDFINRFEVFDRTALAFLYLNPEYILFGVGPNTINIPATKYMSEIDHEIYKGQLNTEPFNFIITVVSRSGLIGLVLLSIGMYRIYNRTKKQARPELANLFILFTTYLIFYNNFLFIVTMGIICGSLLHYSKNPIKSIT